MSEGLCLPKGDSFSHFGRGTVEISSGPVCFKDWRGNGRLLREPVCPTGQLEVQLQPEGTCPGVRQLEDFYQPMAKCLAGRICSPARPKAAGWVGTHPPNELPRLCPLVPSLAALPGTIPQPMNMYPQKYFLSEKKETASRVCR